MNTAEKIIMYGILGMFLLQSFLLFFTKKKALRLIPAGIFAVLWLFSFLLYCGVFGMNDGSFEAGKVFGMMILVFSAYWLAGIAGAAVLYLLVKRIRAGRK